MMIMMMTVYIQLFVQCASVGLNSSSSAAILTPSLSSTSSSSSSSRITAAESAVVVSDGVGLPPACSNMYTSTAAAAAGLLAYPRVAAFPASDYASYGQPPYVPFDSSAFYTPLV